MAHNDRTAMIQSWIERLRDGDPSARAALLECAGERLTRLARKMLRGYPGVGRWEQTDDILQNALLRLDRALKSIAPPTVRDFFRLAAVQVRRELIDLARRYSGPEGLGAHHVCRSGTQNPSTDPQVKQDLTSDPKRLTAWTEFHQAIEALSEEDREVFDLLWYQGLTQPEAAEVLGVSERTINRRWISARLRLSDSLGGQMPI
jgi:RNA polymerase sigma factor (sigma-70 family)